MTKTDRCTGHCCRCFTIPFAPHELEAAYWRWQKGGTPFESRGQQPMPDYTDIHLIAPMVTYIGAFEKPPKAAKQINPADVQLLNAGKFGAPVHFYSCKHFDPQKRICTIYSMRPMMCSAYPNGKPCNYAGCTWKKVKAKKETPVQIRARRKQVRADLKEKTDAGGE